MRVRRYRKWRIGFGIVMAGIVTSWLVVYFRRLNEPLIGLLNSEHSIARYDVIYALGKIGPAAKDAVPALLTRLNDEDAKIRYAVTNVLKQIDPEAAAKAGIK